MKSTIYSKDHKDVADKLKQARKEARVSQAAAAKSLGISQSYLSKLESGQVNINVVALKTFSKFYKKNLNFFIS
jgi:transcriptional regulator with XRE-family HTH domain